MVTRRKRKSASLKGLGVKFGATVRKRYGAVYRILKKNRKCPSCGSKRFSRIALGIWHCPKCHFKLASGAYDISTQAL
jgi:large subunit ribosomal protein L37Ae